MLIDWLLRIVSWLLVVIGARMLILNEELWLSLAGAFIMVISYLLLEWVGRRTERRKWRNQ